MSVALHDFNGNSQCAYAKSNRSKFITLFQALTKSFTNFSFESSQAYTSAMALNSEFEPKIKSALVPVHSISPVLLSRPANTRSSSDVAFHVVLSSSKFVKKSFVSAPFRSVNTP